MFAPRIVNVWNSFARNSNISRYNIYIVLLYILYDYKVDLTRVGNRSQINADKNIVI